MGRKVIFNAKTRRVSVCNALECLIIDESRLGDLPYLVEPMAEKDVRIEADAPSYAALKDIIQPPCLGGREKPSARNTLTMCCRSKQLHLWMRH